MKTLIFSLFCLLTISALSAQSQTIHNLAAATSDMEDQTSLNLSGSWLQSLTKSDDGNFDTRLESLQILNLPTNAGVSFPALSEDLYNEGFELLTEMRSGGSRTEILIKENAQGITDLVLIAKGDDNFTAISLSGLIVLDELDDMNIDVDGWDNFNGRGRD